MSWFGTAQTSYEAASVADTTVGAMLCIELMFADHARDYGAQDVDLIVSARATESATEIWRAAGMMAAIMSGAYVVSSNRVCGADPAFGGAGFAITPDGTLLGVTTADRPCFSFTLDREAVRRQRRENPCYIARRESGLG